MNAPLSHSTLPPTIERYEIDQAKDREGWLALRRLDVTASDVGAVCGLDKNKSPAKIYALKTGIIGEDADNDAMRRGRWFEPAVLAGLREKHPTWDIRQSRVYLRDPALRIGCTLDFVAVDPEREGFGIIQAKTVLPNIYRDQWNEGEDTPLSYELQTMTEGKIAGASWQLLASLVLDPFNPWIDEKDVPFSEGAWTRITGTVKAFWADVAAGREPGFSYSEDLDLIKTMYPAGDPRATPLDMTMNNHIVELADEYIEKTATEKAAKERKEEIAAEIRAVMKDATVMKIAGDRIIKLSDVNVKEYHVAANTYRRLTVGKPKTQKAA